MLTGAVLGLFLRLILAVPADYVARSADGGWERWEHPALAEEGYLRAFVLATWWVGAVVGVYIARRQGGRRADLFCGAVAGGFAGLVGAATAGCLVALADTLPRTLLTHLAAPGLPQRAAQLLWVALAAACWCVGGAVLGAFSKLLVPRADQLRSKLIGASAASGPMAAAGKRVAAAETATSR